MKFLISFKYFLRLKPIKKDPFFTIHFLADQRFSAVFQIWTVRRRWKLFRSYAKQLPVVVVCLLKNRWSYINQKKERKRREKLIRKTQYLKRRKLWGPCFISNWIKYPFFILNNHSHSSLPKPLPISCLPHSSLPILIQYLMCSHLWITWNKKQMDAKIWSWPM